MAQSSQQENDARIAEISLNAELELQHAKQLEMDLEAERILRAMDESAARQSAASVRAAAVLNDIPQEIANTKKTQKNIKEYNDRFDKAIKVMTYNLAQDAIRGGYAF